MKLEDKLERAKKMSFIRNLFDSHGTVSASRFMMFFTIVLGFILNLIMVYELGASIIDIGMWGVLFGSLLPITGIAGYILAKGFETKLELNIGDKKIKIGQDGARVCNKTEEVVESVENSEKQ